MVDDCNQAASAFNKDGFVVLKNVLSEAELERAEQWWSEVRRPLQQGETVQGLKRHNNFYVHGDLPIPVGDFYKNTVIVSFMQKLLGSDLALYMNRINVKDRQFDAHIHMHQDIPYFHGGDLKVSAFTAITEMNFCNGGMIFVKGSHKLGRLAQGRDTIDPFQYQAKEVVIPTLQPGDCLIAHIYVWHASVANAIKKDRALVQSIYQPSTDGSFYQQSLSCPTLVTGRWKTQRFMEWTPR